MLPRAFRHLCVSLTFRRNGLRSNGSFRRKVLFSFIGHRRRRRRKSYFNCTFSFPVSLFHLVEILVEMQNTHEQKRFLIVSPLPVSRASERSRNSFLIFSSGSLFSRARIVVFFLFSISLARSLARARWFVLFELSCSTPQLFSCVCFFSRFVSFCVFVVVVFAASSLVSTHYSTSISSSSAAAASLRFRWRRPLAAVAVFSFVLFEMCYSFLSYISSFTVNVLVLAVLGQGFCTLLLCCNKQTTF